MQNLALDCIQIIQTSLSDKKDILSTLLLCKHWKKSCLNNYVSESKKRVEQETDTIWRKSFEEELKYRYWFPSSPGNVYVSGNEKSAIALLPRVFDFMSNNWKATFIIGGVQLTDRIDWCSLQIELSGHQINEKFTLIGALTEYDAIHHIRSWVENRSLMKAALPDEPQPFDLFIVYQPETPITFDYLKIILTHFPLAQLRIFFVMISKTEFNKLYTINLRQQFVWFMNTFEMNGRAVAAVNSEEFNKTKWIHNWRQTDFDLVGDISKKIISEILYGKFYEDASDASSVTSNQADYSDDFDSDKDFDQSDSDSS